MSSRGSRFSTILQWFRVDGTVDEVRAILPLVVEAAQKRTAPPVVKVAAKRSTNERSVAAKRAWETRRLNEVDKQTKPEVAQETQSA